MNITCGEENLHGSEVGDGESDISPSRRNLNQKSFGYVDNILRACHLIHMSGHVEEYFYGSRAQQRAADHGYTA